jgi:hypothetical protein
MSQAAQPGDRARSCWGGTGAWFSATLCWSLLAAASSLNSAMMTSAAVPEWLSVVSSGMPVDYGARLTS